MNLRDFKSVADRRTALEKETGVRLPNIGNFTLDEVVASSRNCENMIGAAQVPIGVAGPLKVKSHLPAMPRIASQAGKSKVKSYFIPLATTEGALVASVNRGCKAITESGGAVVDSYLVGATRGAVFHVSGLAQNDELNTYIEQHFQELQVVAAKTSKHLTLSKYFSRGLGRQRFVRFVFDTQDAMGMNMATIATSAICQHVEVNTGVQAISVAGNYDVDKKPSWLNSIEGRGIKAWAEVTLSAQVLRDVLKTTAQKVYDVWLAKCMIGSAMSGSMGNNAHFANVLAALFLATGQDMGHVGECSVGMTTVEKVKSQKSKVKSDEEDLYASVYLPDLMIGTVGGGTGLATQREALNIIGAKTSQELAEVVAGAVLAGEVSLLASLSEGTLSRAHQRLARGNTKH